MIVAISSYAYPDTVDADASSSITCSAFKTHANASVPVPISSETELVGSSMEISEWTELNPATFDESTSSSGVSREFLDPKIAIPSSTLTQRKTATFV